MTNRGTRFKVTVAGLAVALAVPAFAFAQTESNPAQPAPAQVQPAPMARGWHGFGRPFGRGVLQSLQDSTGLSGQEIRQQLADGKTLLQIAESKGKTADDVIAAARSALVTKLAAAVTAGQITQAQSDAKLAALSTLTRALIEKRGHLEERDLTAFAAAGFGPDQVLETIAGLAVSVMANYAGNITRPPVEGPFEAQVWNG